MKRIIIICLLGGISWALTAQIVWQREIGPSYASNTPTGFHFASDSSLIVVTSREHRPSRRARPLIQRFDREGSLLEQYYSDLDTTDHVLPHSVRPYGPGGMYLLSSIHRETERRIRLSRIDVDTETSLFYLALPDSLELQTFFHLDYSDLFLIEYRILEPETGSISGSKLIAYNQEGEEQWSWWSMSNMETYDYATTSTGDFFIGGYSLAGSMVIKFSSSGEVLDQYLLEMDGQIDAKKLTLIYDESSETLFYHADNPYKRGTIGKIDSDGTVNAVFLNLEFSLHFGNHPTQLNSFQLVHGNVAVYNNDDYYVEYKSFDADLNLVENTALTDTVRLFPIQHNTHVLATGNGFYYLNNYRSRTTHSVRLGRFDRYEGKLWQYESDTLLRYGDYVFYKMIAHPRGVVAAARIPYSVLLTIYSEDGTELQERHLHVADDALRITNLYRFGGDSIYLSYDYTYLVYNNGWPSYYTGSVGLKFDRDLNIAEQNGRMYTPPNLPDVIPAAGDGFLTLQPSGEWYYDSSGRIDFDRSIDFVTYGVSYLLNAARRPEGGYLVLGSIRPEFWQPKGLTTKLLLLDERGRQIDYVSVEWENAPHETEHMRWHTTDSGVFLLAYHADDFQATLEVQHFDFNLQLKHRYLIPWQDEVPNGDMIARFGGDLLSDGGLLFRKGQVYYLAPDLLPDNDVVVTLSDGSFIGLTNTESPVSTNGLLTRFRISDHLIRQFQFSADRPKLFPNPSDGTFELLMGKDQDPIREWSVFDLLGRRIAQRRFDEDNGCRHCLIHLPELPSGSYYFRANSEDGSSFSETLIIH